MEKNFILRTRTVVLFLLILGFWLLAPVSIQQEALAQQKPIIIRYAHSQPETQSVAKQARVFEKCVKEKSNGKVIIEVYPAAQLFGARDLFPAVRKGAVEISPIVTGLMQGAIPLMEIWEVPFLFQNVKQVTKAWRGYPGEVLKQELEKNGVKMMAEGYFGFMEISNSKREIGNPNDFKGLKIRAPGPLNADIVKAMGGGTIVMGGEEMYLALARKIVDGSITSLESMASRKYWEVQKYITLIHLNYTGGPMLMNLEFWKSLPKEVQNLLQECAKESEEFCLEDNIKQERDATEILKEKGMIFYSPTPAEMEEFHKASAPIKEAWIKKHGDVAEKMVKFVESIK